MSAADPAGYVLAYEKAKRALDEQGRAVDDLRSRAGTLIAAAAIATSFLGGAILKQRHVHTLAWLAVASFALLGATVLVLLWPRHDWQFTVNAQDFIQEYLEPRGRAPDDLPTIHRDLALHMEDSYKANRRQFRWLQAAFRFGAGLLVAEVVFWVLALATQS